MRENRLLPVLCALVLSPFALFAAAAASRADDPLALLPAEAAFVVRISSVEKFAGGFKEMVSTLGPVARPAVDGIDKALNDAFALGSDGAAIDRAAPAFLAGFPLDEPEPIVRIVKASDDARLRRAVLKSETDDALKIEKLDGGIEKVSKDDQAWYFARRGEWVLYTRREGIAQALSFDPAKQATLAKVFPDSAGELAEEGDAAVLVNIARLIEVYGDKLDEQRDKLRRQIDSLPKEFLGGDSSAYDPRATKKMYSDLAELAINAVYDAQWAAGRVNFSAAGVRLAGLLGVKKETRTNDLLTDNPPAALETLGLLPAGAAVYYAYGSYLPSIIDWRRDWLKLAYGDDSEVTQRLLTALKTEQVAEPSATAGSLALPSGVDTSIASVSLTQAKDPEKLRLSTSLYDAAANQQDTALFSQSVELAANAETYRDRPIDVMTTRFKFKKLDDPGQVVGQKFLEKLYGGDSVQSRLTTLEGILVQAAGNDPKYLHNAIDGLESGEKVLGLDDAYAVTRDQLPEKANAILLLDAPRLIVEVLGMFKTIPPLDMVLLQVPLNLGARPATSYFGLSLATGPESLRIDAYLPVTQPQGVLRVFGQ